MDNWFSDHDTLVTFAGILNASGAFENVSDCIYFFTKPWKWTPEYDRWLVHGKPAVIELETEIEDPVRPDRSQTSQGAT